MIWISSESRYKPYRPRLRIPKSFAECSWLVLCTFFLSNSGSILKKKRYIYKIRRDSQFESINFCPTSDNYKTERIKRMASSLNAIIMNIICILIDTFQEMRTKSSSRFVSEVHDEKEVEIIIGITGNKVMRTFFSTLIWLVLDEMIWDINLVINSWNAVLKTWSKFMTIWLRFLIKILSNIS